MKTKYKIGDKVKILCECDFCKTEHLTGKTAIVVASNERGCDLEVNGINKGVFKNNQVVFLPDMNRNGANE